jgi:hypothetical protein
MNPARKAPTLAGATAALALALALAPLGCAGELSKQPKIDGSSTWPDMNTQDTGGLVWPDTMQVVTEGGLDGPAGDAAALDLPTTPDQAVQPDTGIPGVGGACPCKAPLVCIQNACRQYCTAPTDACKAASNCPKTHGCIPLTDGKYVCMPASSPGGACGTAKFCPVNHVCGSVNKGPYICLPTCTTAGAACGTGGQCLGSGCLFCSKL